MTWSELEARTQTSSLFIFLSKVPQNRKASAMASQQRTWAIGLAMFWEGANVGYGGHAIISHGGCFVSLLLTAFIDKGDVSLPRWLFILELSDHLAKAVFTASLLCHTW